MRKIIKAHPAPERIEYKNKQEALDEFGENKFKKEMIQELDGAVSAYRQGDFIDLCVGPHVPNMSAIQAIKVRADAGKVEAADYAAAAGLEVGSRLGS